MPEKAKGIKPHQEPLADQAYYLIRGRILQGVLPPGSVLSRRRLAIELNMSFLPMSQALQRLESEGLVESRPRVGTRVRMPSPDEVRGRFVVREALEAQSAILCCERATFQERLELQRSAESLDTLYARAARGEKDREFLYVVHTQHLNLHMRIADCARCPELKETIERTHILIYNWFFDVTAGRDLPERFHSTLLRAVTGSNVRGAEEAMRQHVRYGLSGTVDAVASRSDGDWRLTRQVPIIMAP